MRPPCSKNSDCLAISRSAPSIYTRRDPPLPISLPTLSLSLTLFPPSQQRTHARTHEHVIQVQTSIGPGRPSRSGKSAQSCLDSRRRKCPSADTRRPSCLRRKGGGVLSRLVLGAHVDTNIKIHSEISRHTHIEVNTRMRPPFTQPDSEKRQSCAAQPATPHVHHLFWEITPERCPVFYFRLPQRPRQANQKRRVKFS